MAALANSSLLSCQSDNPGGHGSFHITGARVSGGSTVTLTFSQPISNVNQIDPNDFRISVGMTYRTIHTDPEGESFIDQSSRYTDLGYYSNPYTRLLWLSATLISDNELALEGERAFGDVCQRIDDYIDLWETYHNGAYVKGVIEMAMFLHYAAGDIPIQDAAGDTIADIAPDWVHSEDLYTLYEVFGFPNITPKIQVYCP